MRARARRSESAAATAQLARRSPERRARALRLRAGGGRAVARVPEPLEAPPDLPRARGLEPVQALDVVARGEQLAEQLARLRGGRPRRRDGVEGSVERRVGTRGDPPSTTRRLCRTRAPGFDKIRGVGIRAQRRAAAAARGVVRVRSAPDDAAAFARRAPFFPGGAPFPSPPTRRRPIRIPPKPSPPSPSSPSGERFGGDASCALSARASRVSAASTPPRSASRRCRRRARARTPPSTRRSASLSARRRSRRRRTAAGRLGNDRPPARSRRRRSASAACHVERLAGAASPTRELRQRRGDAARVARQLRVLVVARLEFPPQRVGGGERVAAAFAPPLPRRARMKRHAAASPRRSKRLRSPTLPLRVVPRRSQPNPASSFLRLRAIVSGAASLHRIGESSARRLAARLPLAVSLRSFPTPGASIEASRAPRRAPSSRSRRSTNAAADTSGRARRQPNAHERRGDDAALARHRARRREPGRRERDSRADARRRRRERARPRPGALPHDVSRRRQEAVGSPRRVWAGARGALSVTLAASSADLSMPPVAQVHPWRRPARRVAAAPPARRRRRSLRSARRPSPPPPPRARACTSGASGWRGIAAIAAAVTISVGDRFSPARRKSRALDGRRAARRRPPPTRWLRAQTRRRHRRFPGASPLCATRTRRAARPPPRGRRTSRPAPSRLPASARVRHPARRAGRNLGVRASGARPPTPSRTPTRRRDGRVERLSPSAERARSSRSRRSARVRSRARRAASTSSALSLPSADARCRLAAAAASRRADASLVRGGRSRPRSWSARVASPRGGAERAGTLVGAASRRAPARAAARRRHRRAARGRRRSGRSPPAVAITRRRQAPRRRARPRAPPPPQLSPSGAALFAGWRARARPRRLVAQRVGRRLRLCACALERSCEAAARAPPPARARARARAQPRTSDSARAGTR